MLLAMAVEANACFLKHICLIYATSPHPWPMLSLPLQLHLILCPNITVFLWIPLLPTQEQKFCRVPLPAELPLLNPKESAWADGK